ncbi:MAG: hypothetical protein JO168_23905 [Solirubrobacterales bacterium]|nr:hypothetical protein [Solirubrobacterales bacterium]
MNRILRHIRANAIAYLALFVALGGTGYAAYSLPAASVGERQLKNHSIDPVKFDPKFIAGTVRAWAVVASNGRVVAGGGGPRAGTPATTGNYEIRWNQKVNSQCSTIATIDQGRSAATETGSVPGNAHVALTAGYALASSSRGASGKGVSFVTTFDQAGQLTPLGFDLAVIC